MLTKKELCETVIEQQISKGNLHPIQSSCLAVSLEFLNRLNKRDKEYAQTRGGILFVHQNGKSLTLRELLRLLPE